MASPAPDFVVDVVASVSAIGIAALCVVMWLRYKERRRRWDHDLCPECGYDLRASEGRCPECGERIRKNL